MKNLCMLALLSLVAMAFFTAQADVASCQTPDGKKVDYAFKGVDDTTKNMALATAGCKAGLGNTAIVTGIAKGTEYLR